MPTRETGMARVELQAGNLYIIMGKRPDRAFDLFKSIKGGGREAMVFARMHPERLEKDFGIPREAVTWLSNSNGPGIVNPQSVGILTDNMVRLYEKDTGPTIIFEGVEYLMTQNDFGKLLKMINFLYETVAVHQGTMVITLDPQAFSEKELAYLTREAVVVEEGDELVL